MQSFHVLTVFFNVTWSDWYLQVLLIVEEPTVNHMSYVIRNLVPISKKGPVAIDKATKRKQPASLNTLNQHLQAEDWSVAEALSIDVQVRNCTVPVPKFRPVRKVLGDKMQAPKQISSLVVAPKQISSVVLPLGRDDAVNIVGLENIGNSCYLNSVLQMIFAMDPTLNTSSPDRTNLGEC
jgi:ubiquitin C-terminal hydrolase